MGEASIEVFLVNGIDGDSEWPFYGISALCGGVETPRRRCRVDAAQLSKMPGVSRGIIPTMQKVY